MKVNYIGKIKKYTLKAKYYVVHFVTCFNVFFLRKQLGSRICICGSICCDITHHVNLKK